MGGRTWGSQQQARPGWAGQDEDDNRDIFGRQSVEHHSQTSPNTDSHPAPSSRGLYFGTGF